MTFVIIIIVAAVLAALLLNKSKVSEPSDTDKVLEKAKYEGIEVEEVVVPQPSITKKPTPAVKMSNKVKVTPTPAVKLNPKKAK